MTLIELAKMTKKVMSVKGMFPSWFTKLDQSGARRCQAILMEIVNIRDIITDYLDYLNDQSHCCKTALNQSEGIAIDSSNTSFIKKTISYNIIMNPCVFLFTNLHLT